MPSRAESEVGAALAAVEAEDASLTEKIEMLMEMAMGLQTRPKTPDHLQQAILLYEKALELCPAEILPVARPPACASRHGLAGRAR